MKLPTCLRKHGYCEVFVQLQLWQRLWLLLLAGCYWMQCRLKLNRTISDHCRRPKRLFIAFRQTNISLLTSCLNRPLLLLLRFITNCSLLSRYLFPSALVLWLLLLLFMCFRWYFCLYLAVLFALSAGIQCKLFGKYFRIQTQYACTFFAMKCD